MPGKLHEREVASHIPCVALTVSDTRTPETDSGGRLIRELLTDAGHRVIAQAILPDDPPQVRRKITELATDPACRAILLTGGTGLAARDTTYEVVDSLLEKRLDGFGELFRGLSYEQVGPAAMLSRAIAGSIGCTAVFSMPGSPNAVRLAMEKLILPELGHIVHLLEKSR